MSAPLVVAGRDERTRGAARARRERGMAAMLLRLTALSSLAVVARSLAMSPRRLGAPSTIPFGNFEIRVLPEKQPAPESLAEYWSVVTGDDSEEQVGTVCFQVSGEAARINSFDIALDGADAATDELVSRFVLAALGARLTELGASIVLPMQVAPTIEVALAALQSEGGKPLMCCDTDGRPLLELPADYVLEQRLLYLSADGQIVAR